MALNTTGAISLAGATAGQSIALELGLGTATQISLNDTAVRTLAGVASGAITMPTNFYGKSNFTPFSRKATYTVNSTLVIPSPVANIRVKAWGGSGGFYSAAAGSITLGGGFAGGDVAVTIGNTLKIAVGGGGLTNAGGTNGGGAGAGGGQGGGGYSGVFANNLASQANALVIAGGSGGTYRGSGTGSSGGGGGTTGGSSTRGAGGGTQSAGGGGVNGGGTGTALQGGNAPSGGSGGGGGYFGGGANGTGGGEAGGGSGYIKAGSTNTTLTQATTLNAANNGDADYVSPAGLGRNTPTGGGTKYNGNAGYVVIYY